MQLHKCKLLVNFSFCEIILYLDVFAICKVEENVNF